MCIKSNCYQQTVAKKNEVFFSRRHKGSLERSFFPCEESEGYVHVCEAGFRVNAKNLDLCPGRYVLAAAISLAK